MPLTKSRYRFPSVSVNQTPSPLAISRLRLYVGSTAVRAASGVTGAGASDCGALVRSSGCTFIARAMSLLRLQYDGTALAVLDAREISDAHAFHPTGDGRRRGHQLRPHSTSGETVAEE